MSGAEVLGHAFGVNAASVAVRGKGGRDAVRRARDISNRYGLGPRRMEDRLTIVAELVGRYGCAATLPIPAVVAARHPRMIARFASRGIEFAVHGHRHIDHAGLDEPDQVVEFARARATFEAHGMRASGFRAPYLRCDEATLDALRMNGFQYDASPAMHWPVEPGIETDAYRRGLHFTGALPATEYPVLPWSEDGLVRIPYVLPDDESVLDRLRLTSPDAIAKLWLSMLRDTHDRGELFTLAVHPERVEACAPAIAAVLDAARASRPPVWIARHDEIARWWRDRAAATVTTTAAHGGRLRFTVRGPAGLTVLARRIDLPSSEPWSDGYARVQALEFDVPAQRRPFIGVHPSSPSSLAVFLREQGYVVEISESQHTYTCYLRREQFGREDQRALLADIEGTAFPLLRFGRWPDGARSALAVTGDVDALTIADYALRFVGR
jgi:peptidoglycan/xylan/chitin deacetylase (PgdA/CDA1 family)